jgi:hypothetical protein
MRRRGPVKETGGGDQTLLSARRSLSIPFATLRTSSLSTIINHPECFLFVGMVGGIAFQDPWKLNWSRLAEVAASAFWAIPVWSA